MCVVCSGSNIHISHRDPNPGSESKIHGLYFLSSLLWSNSHHFPSTILRMLYGVVLHANCTLYSAQCTRNKLYYIHNPHCTLFTDTYTREILLTILFAWQHTLLSLLKWWRNTILCRYPCTVYVLCVYVLWWDTFRFHLLHFSHLFLSASILSVFYILSTTCL